MTKKLMDKIKEGVTVQEVENFARKYTIEVIAVAVIVIGAISGMYDFFSGAKMTILFLAIGVNLGVFFPNPIERGLKQFFSFCYKQEKVVQIVLGAVAVVIGLFVPFIAFCIVGLLAGTSYHYFARHAQVTHMNKPQKPHRHSGDEND